MRALAKSHLYKLGTNLRAWLFTIMHNQHATDMRRHRFSGVPIEFYEASPTLTTRQNQETGLMIDAIDRALQSLPEENRRLIESVALEERPYDDVARSSGLPIGTVKSRVSRGRMLLRRALDGRYVNEVPSSSSPTRGKNGAKVGTDRVPTAAAA